MRDWLLWVSCLHHPGSTGSPLTLQAPSFLHLVLKNKLGNQKELGFCCVWGAWGKCGFRKSLWIDLHRLGKWVGICFKNCLCFYGKVWMWCLIPFWEIHTTTLNNEKGDGTRRQAFQALATGDKWWLGGFSVPGVWLKSLPWQVSKGFGVTWVCFIYKWASAGGGWPRKCAHHPKTAYWGVLVVNSWGGSQRLDVLHTSFLRPFSRGSAPQQRREKSISLFPSKFPTSGFLWGQE